MASIEEIGTLLDKKMAEFAKSMDDKLAPLAASIVDINAKFENCVTHDDLTYLHEEVHSLRDENKSLREKVLQLETQDRRNNLRFLNIPEPTGNETWNDCEEKVLTIIDKLGIDSTMIRIERAHRVGLASANKTRHIIVKFLSYRDREQVLQTFHKKRASVRDVIIREDWPQIIEERRNIRVAVLQCR